MQIGRSRTSLRLVLGGSGGALLLLGLLALLGLALIYDHSAALGLGDAGIDASGDAEAEGRGLVVGSLWRGADGHGPCATRVLVCAVPPDDHDGSGPSTCQALAWHGGRNQHHQQQQPPPRNGNGRALRGAEGAGGAASAALTAAAAQSVVALAAPLLAAAGATTIPVTNNHMEGEGQHRPHEVFTVHVCPPSAAEAGEVGLRVLHHRQPAGTCGRAYLEALLDGPARRLGRLGFTGRAVEAATGDGFVACEYGGALPVGEAGKYRLEVSAVHTGESVGGAVAGLEPYRNYVLWSSAHTFRRGQGGDGGGGRWIRRSTEGPSRINASSSNHHDEAPGYRCPCGGRGAADYDWVEGATTAVASSPPLSPEVAQECVRRLPARANASYPKLVLFGDSFSRQTFNGLARVLGLDNAMAIKAYKSMKQGQDWYGAEQGIELSFQWAPYPEAAESRERLKALLHEERAHVLVNFGAHPICKGPLNRTLELFDDWLAFLSQEVLTAPGVRRRVAWLGTHPRPVAGFHRHHPDHATNVRSLARDASLDAHASRRLEGVGVQVLEVFDLVNPFRDCTEDGTHHLGGVPEAVAAHRVVPWVCGLAS